MINSRDRIPKRSTLPELRHQSQESVLGPLDTFAGDACEVAKNRFRAGRTPSDPGPSRIGKNRRRPSRSRSTIPDLHSRANHHKERVRRAALENTPKPHRNTRFGSHVSDSKRPVRGPSTFQKKRRSRHENAFHLSRAAPRRRATSLGRPRRRGEAGSRGVAGERP